MNIHILGPLEVRIEDRAIALGGSRQRALLALLVLHLNEALSLDRLIDELWGERAPAGAAKSVQVQISRLRKTLATAGDGPIVTRGHGYALVLDPERLDARRFERLVAEAGLELAGGRPEPAARTLDAALALWRGAALADLAYEPFAQAEISRLEELRVAAHEQQIEAELACGRHAEAVARLPALIAEHPYREGLRRQLMLALYRSDRQADALQAFQDARRGLVEELGIEPGTRLRELEQAILAQDPALSLPQAETTAPAAPAEAGAPRAHAPPARRFVSVVAADLAGSAGLAERLDPESLHAIRDRFAMLCGDVLERHGGSLVPHAGERILGIFGLHVRHEDDALRAVRAASELPGALAPLLAELHRVQAIATAVRAGVGTGEVFVGAGAGREAFASGDALAVAGHLLEAAERGETLLTERTYRLVAAHVEAEVVAPLTIAGRRASVPARRLAALRPEPRVAAGPPLIGRTRELDALHALLAATTREQDCRMVTIVGAAGVGKSRLVREFAAAVAGEASVLAGRCLSYGDGITFRPLAEIVRRLAPDEPDRTLAALLGDDEDADRIVARVLAAIGLADEPGTATSETFWAVRRLLEAAARRRPLVVVVEDAHWAEPGLLDLLEYVASFSTGSPLLIVCLARPELLESRPGWAAPQAGRDLLALDALSASEAHAFVGALSGGELEADAAGRIVAMADGNPLFLEQLVAVGAAQDVAGLPPSIEAVLAARIDRLEPDERSVLVHASVEGRTFHRGALAELMPEEARDAVTPALIGLVRKQLVRSDRPEFPGEDAFRFAHVLIREAAYGGLPKLQRADLHERLAGWLARTGAVPDELLGYHLEQAFRNREAVGRPDAGVAAEAAERLATGARAALSRGDAAAGARLLERAVALRPPADPVASDLLAELGEALAEAGRLADADRVLGEAIARFDVAGSERLEARARVEHQLVRMRAGTSDGLEHARRVAHSALADLRRAGDDLGQCRAWQLLAWLEWINSQAARADDAWRRAADHARRAGDDRERFEILGWRASAAAFGPTPVAEAIGICTELRRQVERSPLAVAVILHPLALLHAMTGAFDLARQSIDNGNEILGELGRMESTVSHHEALVELLAGRPAAAEACLRPGYEELARMGEQPLLATTAAVLAMAVYAQDRFEEAGDLCDTSERLAAVEDVATQAMWRGVRAKLSARRGDAEPAEVLAREAVRLAEPTDLLVVRGDAWLDLAEVLALDARAGEAEAAAAQGFELYVRKGSVVSATRSRVRPAALARPEPTTHRR